MNTLIISDIFIRQDSEGRYCLNDLYRAAGWEDRHQPTFFMRRQETADLVQAIGSANSQNLNSADMQGEIQSANSQSAAVKTINGGLKRGTYVCKELVYAYAMWVSPEFHREVAHAFETHSLEKEMTETAEKPNTPFSEQQEALTQQLYERKCDKPSPEDILNALYELELPLPLERRTLAKRIYESWASNVGLGVAIRSTWFGSDAEFGAFIRAWFKKDFLEVSEIEAQEEMARRTTPSEEIADNACPESVGAGETT